MAHPVVYFEIGCRDRAKTEQFFGTLFGWHIEGNGPASAIDTGGQQGIPTLEATERASAVAA